MYTSLIFHLKQTEEDDFKNMFVVFYLFFFIAILYTLSY